MFQGVTALPPQGDSHSSLPLPYPTAGGAEGGAGPKRPVSLTRGVGPSKSPQKLGKLTDHFGKAPGLHPKSELI